MSTIRRPVVNIPPELRSALPAKRGVTWWAAIAIAVLTSLLGVLIDWARVDELAGLFSALYFLGCVGAVVAVQYRSLFTAMVQPPLLLFVGVPVSYYFITAGDGAGLRTRVVDLVLPLVTLFPLMLLTTAAVLIIGGIRVLGNSQGKHRPTPMRRVGTTGPHR